MIDNIYKYGIKHLFIGPVEISGVAEILKKEFDKIGIKSTLITFNNHPFGYTGNKSLDISNRLGILKFFLLLFNFIKSICLYDSFLFIFSKSLLPFNMDLPILKLFGKKTIMIFCGCDIRSRDLLLKDKNIFIACRECKNNCNANKKRDKIYRIQKYADVIYSQPEYSQLLTRKYKYFWVPVNPNDYKTNFIINKIPVIVHAPSDRKIKGTNYVQNAINKLKKDGYVFKFFLLENLPNKKVQEYLQNCDIVVDQLLVGWHGTFAIEAMASGKPVLCYLKKDLIRYSPEIPIVSTNPDNIYENLKLMIENAELRISLGKKGRKYVEKYHDANKIAIEILKDFSKIK